MADQEPLFNQKDISDEHGPIDTKVGGDIKTEMRVHDKDVVDSLVKGPGAHTFSSKYRTVPDEPESPLALTASYQTLFTYSGSGKFVGFVSTFSNINVKVRFTIDTDEVFELEAAQINDAQFNNPTSTGPSSQTTTGGPVWDQTGRRYGFMPSSPIGYATTVKIEALKVGAPAINYIRAFINLTKET